VSQSEIAKRLEITQAAVSKYISQSSKGTSLTSLVSPLTNRLLNMIIEGRANSDLMLKEVCSTCMLSRMGGAICQKHRESVQTLGDLNCQICMDLLGGSKEIFIDRATVLGEMQEALSKIEESLYFERIIPQVRANLVACGKDAESLADIAGVPGRITLVSGRARAVSGPQFGASRHTAGLLLWMRKTNPDIRACLCVSGQENVVDVARTTGFQILRLDNPAVEVEEIADAAKSKLQTKKATNLISIHVPGGIGIEPILYLFGTDAISLSQLSIKMCEQL
jgi:predicted fused transcriptional regulator/phosphomethylpyrimidine kinase/predicted transcriptional regulator